MIYQSENPVHVCLKSECAKRNDRTIPQTTLISNKQGVLHASARKAKTPAEITSN